MRVAILSAALLTALVLARPDPAAPAPTGRPDGVPDFALEVRPILARACFACHGRDAEHRAADLRLDTEEGARSEREGGAAVVAGEPARSALLGRVRAAGEDRMPPPEAGPALTPAEIGILERWIAGGAPWAAHWSFVPLASAPAPSPRDRDWPRDDLDREVLARLEAEGLRPAPEADRFEYGRRVAFALTGLPPSPEDLDAFAEDAREDAVERFVDGLLDSSAAAERWAAAWLDLARYADSAGYASDEPRVIWRYRDWVIDAFRRNLPYDRFLVEQIAGDLLPDATVDQILATAFHRNTMTNNEGGTDDEEFRVAAVRDRVETTMQVAMGITAACARCHDHKYDPLSQEDYFRLFAVFDQTEDHDQPDERPRLATPTPEQVARRDGLAARRRAIEARLEAPDPELDAEEARWRAGLATEAAAPTVLREVRSDRPAFRVDEGGWLVANAEGPAPERARDRFVVPSGARFDALRLELEPWADGGLRAPGGGGANVVISGVELAGIPRRPRPAPRARFVRVALEGPERILSLAEVEARSGDALLPAASARQSSEDFGGAASRAIDGVTEGRYERGSVTHTRISADPWWELDLGRERELDSVVLHNRADGLEARLAGARVELLGERRDLVLATRVPSTGARVAIDLTRAPRLRRFEAARATFAQEGWPVAAALAAGEGRGWGLAPRADRPQAAWFGLAAPVAAEADEDLVVRVDQSHGARHVAGRMRLAIALAGSLPVPRPAEIDLALGRDGEDDRRRVRRFFRTEISTLAAPLRRELDALREEEAALTAAIPTTPVMRERPPERRRVTRIHEKGNFLSPGRVVEPGLPTSLAPDAGGGAPPDRLALARWLVGSDNPLTARVAVNRIWARLFGRGLVLTEGDFGAQGSPPDHPGLLDRLARDFVRGGWDRRALIRRIVLSATFRQSALASPAARQRDPRNVRLSRGPRVRLDAEMVRDQALAAAGLLSRKIGGPSVYPPQPPGLWRAAFNGDRTWPTSSGENRYRRGIYTFVRRTTPYPAMTTFDAPSRELCTVRRLGTNTPLQALVTLNDPVFVEAAQALARRVLREAPEVGVDDEAADAGSTREGADAGSTREGADAGSTREVADAGAAADPGEVADAARATRLFRLVLGRPPESGETAALVDFVVSRRRDLAARPEEARLLATDPLGPLPAGADPVVLAAWTAAANAVLNLDAALVR
ncbi:MAG: DUF1553 domain-containing protein [Planctomycetota bacterium]